MNRSTPKPRYAIYFVPEADTCLYRFGASVLGYDCYTGRENSMIDNVDAPSWTEFVREPRIYGFHATLKAPFYLASGLDEATLERAVTDFASDHPAVWVGDLAIRELGSFIALVPKRSTPSLDRLANACVQEFDQFRAPTSEAERERRLASGLSVRQLDNLDRWGYPYIFEDFRFHMTLTGRLALPERSRVLQFLGDKFREMAATELLFVGQIVICRQNDSYIPFQVSRRATLGHSPYRPYAYSF